MARLKIVHDRTVRNAFTLSVVGFRLIKVSVHEFFIIVARSVTIRRWAILPLIERYAECHGFIPYV